MEIDMDARDIARIDAARRRWSEEKVRRAVDRLALLDFENAAVGDRLAATHYHLTSTVSPLALIARHG